MALLLTPAISFACLPPLHDANINSNSFAVMQATIHIGMPKTGTTTLQRTFTANASLLDEAGILYPTKLSSSSMNHRILAYYTRELSNYPRHMRKLKDEAVSRQSIDELAKNLSERLQEKTYSHLIFSAESLFYPIPNKKSQAFFDFMSQYDSSPIIVAYLRSPCSFYLAVCQQKLRASTSLKSLAPPKYRDVLESYQRTFPESRVSPRLFERNALISKDIVHDFWFHSLKGAMIDLESIKIVCDSNISLSPEAMAASRLYRLSFWANSDDEHTPGTKKLINVLRQADRHVGPKKAVVKPEIRDALEAFAASDLIWLRDQHGVVFSDIDYDLLNLDRTNQIYHEYAYKPLALSEIVVIDLSRFVAIIDYLRASRFVSERPELATWIRDLRLADLQGL